LPKPFSLAHQPLNKLLLARDGRLASLGAGFGPSPSDTPKRLPAERAPGTVMWFGFFVETQASAEPDQNTFKNWQWNNG